MIISGGFFTCERDMRKLDKVSDENSVLPSRPRCSLMISQAVYVQRFAGRPEVKRWDFFLLNTYKIWLTLAGFSNFTNSNLERLI